MTDLALAETFAKALDHDDFSAAGVLLSDGCTYDSPKGRLDGREAILASYRSAAGRARNVLDDVTNASAIRPLGSTFAIEYTDRVRAGLLAHTYRCEQHVRCLDGRIDHIAHVELPEERQYLEAFLARVARRVLVIVYPGCILYEVQLAIELVGEQTRIILVSPDGKPVNLANGMSVGAEYSFANAPRNSVVGVLIPGGDPGVLVGNVELSALLNAVAENGAKIGAICAGPLVLGQAGLLKGKRFTHGYRDRHPELLAPFWEGATFEDSSIVEDEPLLTAQPQAHIDFGVHFARKLGCLDHEAAKRAQEFYLGRRISRLS